MADDITYVEFCGADCPREIAIPYDGTQTSDITAHVGDTLQFTWSGNHNVMRMASREAYDNCDFNAGATNLGSSSPVSVTVTSLPVYFACSIGGGSHCRNGVKREVSAGPSSVVSYSQTLTGLSTRTCSTIGTTVQETSASKLGVDKSEVEVTLGSGGFCNQGRRLLTTGSQTFDIAATVPSDRANAVKNMVSSSSYAGDFAAALKKSGVDATVEPVQSDQISSESVMSPACEDVQPPMWYVNNSCAKQKSAGKCPNRMLENSMYCKKTCGMCGDYKIPACHDLQPPTSWRNNSCAKQKATGKCVKRKQESSKYCRKTCDICS